MPNQQTTLAVNRRAFIAALIACNKVRPNKSSNKYLSMLRLESKGGRFTVSATDSDTWIEIEVDVPSTQEGPDFACLVSYDIRKVKLGRADTAAVTFTVDTNKPGVPTLSLGGVSFDTCDPSEHYACPSVTGEPFELTAPLTRVASFVSTDMLRPAMTGVYFDRPQKYIVGVDGHRLYAYPAELGDGVGVTVTPLGFCRFDPDEPVTVTLPADDPANKARVYARLQQGAVTITARCLPDRFPNWKAVVPEDNGCSLEIHRAAFAAAVEQVKPAASRMTEQIKLYKNGRLLVSAEDIEHGRAAETQVDAEGILAADKAMGFNANYLLEALNAAEGKFVEMRTASPNRAARFYDPTGAVNLVMPVMLNTYS